MNNFFFSFSFRRTQHIRQHEYPRIYEGALSQANGTTSHGDTCLAKKCSHSMIDSVQIFLKTTKNSAHFLYASVNGYNSPNSNEIIYQTPNMQSQLFCLSHSSYVYFFSNISASEWKKENFFCINSIIEFYKINSQFRFEYSNLRVWQWARVVLLPWA